MSWHRRLSNVLRPERMHRELARELSFHIAERAEELEATGLSPQEALRRARGQFGNYTIQLERTRDMDVVEGVESALRNLRYAVRSLRKAPGFAATVVLTLALGIGANTAIFGVLKHVVLNELPYGDPSRIVSLEKISPWTAHELAMRSRTVENISIYGDGQRILAEGGRAEMLRGLRTNFGFFVALGVQPMLGRAFVPDDDRWPRKNVVILSCSLWQRRFGGDPGVIGRVLQLTDEAYRVIGVLPPDFHPLRMSNPAETPEIYMPAGYDADHEVSCKACIAGRAIARLKPGARIGAASKEINGIVRDLVGKYPSEFPRDGSIRLEPLRDQLVGPVRTAIWVVMGAVALVLLIACANVTNLLLARATSRAKEMAVRAAVGASGLQLAMQVLTEGILLSAAGGALAVVVGLYGMRVLTSLAPRELPRLDEIRLDWSVFLFNVAVSLLAGFLAAFLPAWRASRIDLSSMMKEGASGGHRRGRVRNLLIVVEVALAFVLVQGTGLLGKSFLRLTEVNAGFDPRHVLTMTLTVAGERYRKPEVALRYYHAVMERVRRMPGVLGAACVTNVPISRTDEVKLRIAGEPVSDGEAPDADVYWASPNYFRVMKISLRRGRLFTEHEGLDVPPVALISESLAKARFGGTDPIGQTIRIGSIEQDRRWLEVVGVVADVRNEGLDHRPDEAVYLPHVMVPFRNAKLVVRTSGDPRRFEHAVVDTVQEVDPLVPVFHIQPMEDFVAAPLADRNFTLALIGLFGTLALLLAAVGIYGVVSYTTGLRVHEFAIRFALGAGRVSIVGIVLRDLAALVGGGLAAGFLGGMPMERLLADMLYQVRPADWTSAAGAAVVLAAAGLAAAYIPTEKASRVDPASSLGVE